MPSARVLPRVVRHLWRLRGRLEGHKGTLLSEVATAVDTLIQTSAIARAAMGAYRLAMRVLLVAAVLAVVAGAALAIGLRDSTVAIVIGVVIAAIGLWIGWQWWLWSAGLRLLKEHVDPNRRVPPGELPGRFVRLADEVRPTSRSLASELQDLARLVREPKR